jgi:alpha/beta superfamily hydrolase
MTLTLNQLIPGEHPMMLDGVLGQIEACFTIPSNMDTRYVAILGHPHSLQGGTMNNKVVTTLVRVFKDLNIASLRFNFRGVGQSEGEYDAGIGESEDMLHLAKQCIRLFPGASLCFAGFSFGSYVAYRAASACAHRVLVTVAPPVHHYDYTSAPQVPAPWFVVQGDHDDVVPVSLVLDFAKTLSLPVLRFPEAGHFFHGQLIALKDQLGQALATELL